MRKISISQIQGNETLAKPIYDGYGKILLAKGTTLKPGYKMRLTQMGILSLYINDKFSKEIEIEDFISDHTRQETKTIIKNEFHKFITKRNTSSSEITKSVDKIIDNILSREEVIVNISDIKSKDQYLYEHSVNVCALSVIMGIHLGYNKNHLRELAAGALLHDLGKLLTPEDIITKSKIGKLNEEEMSVVKKHPLDGYEILNEKYDISYVSKAIILMHHEHCNGTGYPLGLKDDKLHETVKLVSICNMFDNLTSDFYGDKKMEVYEALEYLITMSGSIFDKKLVNVFIENVAAYPSGSFIKLNTGASGIVLKQNKKFCSRPIINILVDENGNKLSESKELDLSKETTLFIIGTLETLE
ncbi:HD-GYP domain-containing protein [Clostridium ganghwense]|uniref:HD-GYP domain-containing protein n=1 Tax=Clostridium ganghwense TaxID=312089 RepID=A0ABT4CSG2_9CLOT|nr:HD-GYP domain-containing protein [Clostridium ganghwense]MCY6372008.1 HD-GYP domain-containing protein [Clostridium ganghwense]